MCALVLTIPFGFFQYFNSDFFTSEETGLKYYINTCRSLYSEDEFNLTYKGEVDGILNEISTCIMSSLSALITAVIYYLFKPDEFEMEIFMRRNGNILLGTTHTLTRTCL